MAVNLYKVFLKQITSPIDVENGTAGWRNSWAFTTRWSTLDIHDQHPAINSVTSTSSKTAVSVASSVPLFAHMFALVSPAHDFTQLFPRDIGSTLSLRLTNVSDTASRFPSGGDLNIHWFPLGIWPVRLIALQTLRCCELLGQHPTWSLYARGVP